MTRPATALSKILTLLAFGVPLFLVMKYHDEPGFQAALKFLLEPDSSRALPPLWHEYRMVAMGGLLLALVAYYSPAWRAYRSLAQLHRETRPVYQEPPLSPLHASFVYRQDLTTCVVAWLAALCHNGALLLHHKAGARPWAVTRGASHDLDPEDQDLLGVLFRTDERVELRAVVSEPHRDLREAADRMFRRVRAETGRYFGRRRGSLPAWLFALAVIAEIPFHVAGQPDAGPGVLPLTIMSAALLALPVYAVCHEFTGYFGGARVRACILIGAAILFASIGQSLLLSNAAFGSYVTTALIPGLAVSLVVAVWNAPLLPADPLLLPAIIGYRKHVNHEGYRIEEVDLPWTLGLGVHADVLAGSFHYAGHSAPAWLRTDEHDIEPVMKLLHQTLGTHVNQALHGEMESRRHSSIGRISSRP